MWGSVLMRDVQELWKTQWNLIIRFAGGLGFREMCVCIHLYMYIYIYVGIMEDKWKLRYMIWPQMGSYIFTR